MSIGRRIHRDEVRVCSGEGSGPPSRRRPPRLICRHPRLEGVVRRRLSSLFVAFVLSAALLPVLAVSASAATCVGYDYRFEYAQNYAPYGLSAHEIVTIHAKGCYDGTKSWGTSMEAQIKNTWAIYGAWAKPDPTMESARDMYGNLNGSTSWRMRPAYAGNGGVDFLLAPTVTMTKTGSWTAFDVGLKACEDSKVGLFGYTLSWGALPTSYGPQYGPDDLQGSSTTASCPKLSWPVPSLVKVERLAFT